MNFTDIVLFVLHNHDTDIVNLVYFYMWSTKNSIFQFKSHKNLGCEI